MNQNDPTMRDFDDRLDRAIDALNNEVSPAPHEHGDLELFSLVDTARLAKSLRDPAEPDPDFAELAVSRIAADLGGSQVMNANGIPPASPPSVRALPSTDSDSDDRPRGIVGWLRDMSELAAILVVGLLVLGGIVFYQTVWSGGDGDSPGAGPNPTATEEPAPAIIELEIEGLVCCGTHGEIDGESYLFVLSQGGEELDEWALHAIHVDERGSLELAGSIDTPLAIAPPTTVPATLGGTSRLGFENGKVYVPVPGREESGLWVVDVSDPASPAEVDLVEMERPPLSVAVSNGVAAVSTMSFSGPIVFFDVSNPDDVQPVSEYEHSMSSMPPSIEFVDSLLYVADYSGVSIFDLSTPEEPQEVGAYENPDWDGPPTASNTGIQSEDDERLGFHDIAVVDQYLYIAANDAGLRVVDASDPSNPQETSQFDLPDRAIRVVALENMVYVLGMDLTSGQPFNLRAIDASNPANPQLTGTVAVPIAPFVQTLVTGDDTIFLLGGRTVQIIDPDADSSPADGEPAPPTPVEPTPEEAANQDAPDPELLSFEETQDIAPFELIQPDPVPEELELIGVDVHLASDTMPVDEAYLLYRLVDGEMSEKDPIIFKQSNARLEASHWSATEKVIGSRTVTAFQTAVDEEGIPLAVYAWTEGDNMDRSYMVSARLAGDVTEQHLESLIAALPDEDAGAVDPEGSTLADPIEFVLVYRQALEEGDMETVRSMLVERFREFDDELLHQGAYQPVDSDIDLNPANWSVEQNEHFTVVRLNDIPTIAYVLQRGENNEWLADRGPVSYWYMQRTSNDDFDDFEFEGIEVERISDQNLSDTDQFIGMHIDLVEIQNDNTVDVSVEWRLTHSQYGSFPIDDLRWVAGDESGSVEIIWSTAQLNQDVVAFPTRLDEPGATAIYSATFTLLDVPVSGDLELHIPEMTFVDDNGNEMTFSAIFYFPNEEYP